MDHIEAVVEFKNAVNSELIKRVIKFSKNKCKENLKVGVLNTAKVNKDIRNVKGYYLKQDGTPTQIFYWNYIKNQIERLYSLYIAKFPMMKSTRINQIDLLKYTPGGKYEIHIDQATHESRHLSIIINLNDDYEGGDLIFTDQKKQEIKKIKLGKGSIVFFPSNFMYPHSIKPITKGTRYSIVAWLE
jgi:predicted 2-oxoglutarate/Fe(II)-dependent dioxygenase YbiX|tara:strand:+ start:647 stop:1207 length:561 start_codon:yes stop_codon:yes gene_type:complete